MQAETVICSACGAPLTIPETVEYVACRYCQAQLHVQRNQSVVFTEVLQSLQKQTERIADTTDVLRIQNEIALLDREWEQQSAGLMVHGKHGRVSVPDKTSAVVGGTVITLFGLFWTAMAGLMFPPMALFGLLFISLGLWNTFKVHNDAGRYTQLRTLHDQKRQALRDQLQMLNHPESH
ncbi:MAG TPA: hypothetical protein VFG20_15290 [Planctomycetaceae bacterium]|nr:hypothetical protein [Planctomycetaceae bacterium]